jgi:ABC-type Zn2+ transport system substrate-binding protein/surface adhesin
VPSVTSSDRPRVSTRPSGWPVRRMPRWVLLAVALFLVAGVAVALVHRPSTAERASDMTGFLQEVNADIESCSGGVAESLTALHQVQAEHFSNSSDVGDGASVASQGAQNCEPANNEEIDNLENYQVPESLDSFGLVGAVTNLVTWAVPDAERVQTDVAQILSAATPQARNRAQQNLSRDLNTLNAERAKIEAPIAKAIKALHMHAAPPRLAR